MHHYRAFTQFAALLSPIEAERKRNAWTMASTVDSCNCKKRLEARVGIEPTHKGFADLSLTTWVPRPSLLDDQSVRLCFCREFAERSDPSRGARRRLNHRDAEELREKSPPWRLCGRKITKFL